MSVTKYFQPAEGLPQRLLDGDVRLLRTSWLLEQPEDFVLLRQQELPPEAFVVATHAFGLLRDSRVAAAYTISAYPGRKQYADAHVAFTIHSGRARKSGLLSVQNAMVSGTRNRVSPASSGPAQ